MVRDPSAFLEIIARCLDLCGFGTVEGGLVRWVEGQGSDGSGGVAMAVQGGKCDELIDLNRLQRFRMLWACWNG